MTLKKLDSGFNIGVVAEAGQNQQKTWSQSKVYTLLQAHCSLFFLLSVVPSLADK